MSEVIFHLYLVIASRHKDVYCKPAVRNVIMASTVKHILEVQAPFSRLILSGKKSIETRSYQLPEDLLHTSIVLCESAPGLAGVSTLSDSVIESQPGLLLIGEIYVSHSKEYTSQEEWDEDRECHQVPSDSAYEWTPTEIGRRYGWYIERVTVYSKPLSVPAMRRR